MRFNIILLRKFVDGFIHRTTGFGSEWDESRVSLWYDVLFVEELEKWFSRFDHVRVEEDLGDYRFDRSFREQDLEVVDREAARVSTGDRYTVWGLTHFDTPIDFALPSL